VLWDDATGRGSVGVGRPTALTTTTTTTTITSTVMTGWATAGGLEGGAWLGVTGATIALSRGG
jgi:hypothetical protein